MGAASRLIFRGGPGSTRPQPNPPLRGLVVGKKSAMVFICPLDRGFYSWFYFCVSTGNLMTPANLSAAPACLPSFGSPACRAEVSRRRITARRSRLAGHGSPVTARRFLRNRHIRPAEFFPVNQFNSAGLIPVCDSAPCHPASRIRLGRSAPGNPADPIPPGQAGTFGSDNPRRLGPDANFNPDNPIPPSRTATFGTESGILPDRSETFGHTKLSLPAENQLFRKNQPEMVKNRQSASHNNNRRSTQFRRKAPEGWSTPRRSAWFNRHRGREAFWTAAALRRFLPPAPAIIEHDHITINQATEHQTSNL